MAKTSKLLPYVDPARKQALKRLCRRHISNAGKSHLLEQPILKRFVGPLDTTLGLRRRGANLRDAQPLRHPVERGQPIAAVDIVDVDRQERPTT